MRVKDFEKNISIKLDDIKLYKQKQSFKIFSEKIGGKS